MSLNFSIVQKQDSSDLAQLIAIYQEAIEPSEQKSPTEIEGMLDDPRYALTVCCADSIVKGFSIAYFPEAADFWLLEYMAVAASTRSRGLGEAIFLHAYQYGLERDSSRICVLEVDQPGGSTSPHNNTRARFRFYKRLGCRAVEGLDYILPLETAGTPPPMLLLTYRRPPLVAMRRNRLQRWLSTIYQAVYGQAADDPRIDIMTSHLEDTVRVVELS